MLDDDARRSILGVILVVCAIALLIIAVIPTNAVVSSLVANWIHLLFGVGCYLLPIVLALIGVSFFIRIDKQRLPTRVAVGLALLFIAFLGLMGAFTPGVDGDVAYRLFMDANLLSQGGYIGAAIAWLGLTLFGTMVTVVLLLGVCVVALIIIGFSINKLVDKIRSAPWPTPHSHADKPLDPADQAFPRDDGDEYGTLPMRADAPTRRGFSSDDFAIPPQGADESTAQLAGTDALATRKLGRAGRQAKPTRASRPLGELSSEEREMPTVAFDEAFDESPEPDALTRKLPARSSKRAESASSSKAGSAQAPVPAAAAPPDAEAGEEDGFQLPPMSLLKSSAGKPGRKENESQLRNTALLLQQTLASFHIDVGIAGWVAGPTVTLYKVELPSGVRVNRITSLTDDIALALAAPGVRIFSPVPGTNYVGIEVPNKQRETVLLGDVLPAAEEGPLQVAIGKDVEGHSVVSNLAKMPHLLIGGTTGSGKSVSINAMIMSILMRSTPDEARFILIDPKRVEFMPYDGIPHLYVPVVTEPKEASSALAWGVAEMERRLKLLSKAGVREITQYNAKVDDGLMNGDEPATRLPYIVIVIDELADLMMNVGKEVEFSISRLAQLARAAGIHLIVATQRPSTNVVTGLIKANITNRIAFNVASGIDSRVILDSPGAEHLIGLGDMLLSKPEYAKPQRLQACYVSEEETEAVVAHLKSQGEPEYHSEILNTNLMSMGTVATGTNGSSANEDPLLWEAAEIVVSSKLGSTSNIQRRLQVGYSRAGRIMDMLEEKGVVGPPNGSKPREVLVDELELETLKAFEAADGDSV